MLKLTLGIAVSTAVFGLLFYWRKKRKKQPLATAKGEQMAYGVQVMNSRGGMENLTDRPVMVVDLVSVPFGVNGSRTFSVPVSGISVSADYDFDPAIDGKYLSATYSGNTVRWEWKSAKAVKSSSANIIVLTGGANG